jgi:Holliday junction resolvasome RuvABC endonuclease subunit
MSAAEVPRVAAGRIGITRLYDLAYAVDLEQVERDVRDSATRLSLGRAKPRAVYYARPPVDVALGQVEFTLASQCVTADVRARIYDFGAVRLAYEVAVEQLPWPSYVALANELDAVFDRPAPWDADLARVRELIARALEKPSEPGLQVDYLFATVRSFDPPLLAQDVLSRLDLVPLLTGDTRPLSGGARHDAVSHTLSYYQDDLVVIDSSRALIVEPGFEADVADVLAVAHAQLLELWYYNERLDAELPRMYDRIEKARETFAGLARRRNAALARSLHGLLAEVTEVAERVENALVVTEDVYLAKVYEAALEHFRVRAWGAAVDRKLAIIRDTYTALYNEATSARAEYLEMAIVFLILFEIVWAFLR